MGWLRKRAEQVYEEIQASNDAIDDICAIETVAREFAERALQHGLYGKLLDIPTGDAPIAKAIEAADEVEP